MECISPRQHCLDGVGSIKRIENIGFQDLVSSKPYESSVLMVNQAPFLQSEINTLETKTASPKNEEVKEISNEETLS